LEPNKYDQYAGNNEIHKQPYISNKSLILNSCNTDGTNVISLKMYICCPLVALRK